MDKSDLLLATCSWCHAQPGESCDSETAYEPLEPRTHPTQPHGHRVSAAWVIVNARSLQITDPESESWDG